MVLINSCNNSSILYYIVNQYSCHVNFRGLIEVFFGGGGGTINLFRIGWVLTKISCELHNLGGMHFVNEHSLKMQVLQIRFFIFYFLCIYQNCGRTDCLTVQLNNIKIVLNKTGLFYKKSKNNYKRRKIANP